MQALHVLALDPIAETTAAPNSYGVRQGRATADALAQCSCDLAKTTSAQGVLEGDLKACVDELSHAWMLTHTPMAHGTRTTWLKAGYVDQHGWQPTEAGAPQGGLSSPVWCNMTLEGLEQTLKQQCAPTESIGKRHQVHVVRYADDFVITGRSKALLEPAVKPLVESVLAQRGLQLSPTKTRITPSAEGFAFLGTNLRQDDGKFLIKPSKKNVPGVLKKIKTTLKRHVPGRAEPLIGTLNPIIHGWANDHRPWSSKETCGKVDPEINRQVWRWAQRKHSTRSGGWIKKKYFAASATRRGACGVTRVGRDGKPETVRLARAQSTPIQRHIKIRSPANPYDPAWESSFDSRPGRQMQAHLPGRKKLLRLWTEPRGTCPICRQQITKVTGWNIHPLQWRVNGGTDAQANLVWLHPNCHRQVHSRGSTVTKPRPVERALVKA